MSVQGQKLTSTRASGTSALPPTTDIRERGRQVCFKRASGLENPKSLPFSVFAAKLTYQSEITW
jgi:hypothetical protein